MQNAQAAVIYAASPKELISMQERCVKESKARKQAIEKTLSAKFAALDPAFVRVATSQYEREGLVRLLYFVRHPQEAVDPVKFHPMTIKSGRENVLDSVKFFTAPVSTGEASADQMAKIKKIDPVLRDVYERFMVESPVIVEDAGDV
jgi:hypothetical protein